MPYFMRRDAVDSIEINGKGIDFVFGVLDCAGDADAFSLHFQTPQWVLLPDVGRYRVTLADGRVWAATGREVHPNPWAHDVVHGGGAAGFDPLVPGREYWLSALSQAAVSAATNPWAIRRGSRHPDPGIEAARPATPTPRAGILAGVPQADWPGARDGSDLAAGHAALAPLEGR